MAWAKSNREESNRRSRNEKEFTQSPWLYVLRCAISDLCVHYTCTPLVWLKKTDIFSPEIMNINSICKTHVLFEVNPGE